METPEVRNWFGNIASSPKVVAEPRNVEELIAVMRNSEAYPSPVRAVGSNHSTTPCGAADDGTLVVMRYMNRILNIGPDTVTAEAGALYIDVAKELQQHSLQFHVSTEIGSLSLGSGACCGTKDASMSDEFGQVCSYAIAMKMVTPSGEVVEVTEAQPELLQAMRSSYGLFGIVYEVTFRVKPLRSMAVRHKTYRLKAFDRELPGLKARGDSIMMYINPFINKITVEFRRYRDDQDPRRASSWQWRLRNYAWGTLGPYVSYLATNYIPMKGLRYLVIDRFHQFINFVLVLVMRGKNTLPPDQIIRYPEKSTNSRYIFSIWAFPEQDYMNSLRDYFLFCHDYYWKTGYRWDLPNVGYRIKEDTSSLFSYSFNGPVMTFDPVSTGNPGWEEFLAAYNDFCSRHGGSPLFNQTGWLTREQIEKAFGERLKQFAGYRQRFDPNDRLLNEYFRKLLA
jgi:FAD binding domain/D-arabinono-1,4-lactone oxidase